MQFKNKHASYSLLITSNTRTVCQRSLYIPNYQPSFPHSYNTYLTKSTIPFLLESSFPYGSATLYPILTTPHQSLSFCPEKP